MVGVIENEMTPEAASAPPFAGEVGGAGGAGPSR